MVLYVHERNPALGFYLKYNFVEFGKPYLNPDNGRHYTRFVLDLLPNSLATLASPPASPE